MNLRIDILTLQLFVTIVEEKSIAKAAEKRNIAASAVSRRISDLEELLHVQLLRRHAKGIEPTPAGLALLDHARIVLGNVAQLETELTGYRQGVRGHIRLFVNRSAILQSLAPELSAFLVSHPLVQVDLEESISPETIQAVAENRADLGIFGGNIRSADLQVFPYREDRLVAVVPRDHPLARRQGVGFAELMEHEFVGVEKGSSIDTLCVRAASELGRQFKTRIRVSGFDAMFRLVEARLGVGVAPQAITEERAGRGLLAGIALDEPWARRSLVLGMRDYGALPRAARLLVEHLRVGTPLS